MITDAHLDELQQLFVAHGVVLAYLFGSQAEGAARLESDVDIAVLLPPGTPRARFSAVRLSLMNELMALLQRDVDVAVLNEVRASLAYDVAKSGVLLYEDPQTRPAIDFVVAARRYYLDTAKFRRLAAEGLREEIEMYRLQRQELLAVREKRDGD